jgi:hypothetical protein
MRYASGGVVYHYVFVDESVKSGKTNVAVFIVFFYCCTMHFEDSLIITYQQMH